MSSYTPPPSGYLVPAAPGSGPRPSSVTVSSLLLHLIALVLVVYAAVQVYVAALIPADFFQDLYADQGMDQTTAETAAGIAKVVTYAVSGSFAVFALFFVVLGIFVGKGKQWARVTTWVFAGIGLCCTGFSLLSSSASLAADANVDQEEMARRMAEAVPAWTTPVGLVLLVAGLLGLIAVIVLLMLPPSNAYFRKPAPEWTPPAYPTV